MYIIYMNTFLYCIPWACTTVLLNYDKFGDLGPSTALLYVMKSLKFYGWASFFLFSCAFKPL